MPESEAQINDIAALKHKSKCFATEEGSPDYHVSWYIRKVTKVDESGRVTRTKNPKTGETSKVGDPDQIAIVPREDIETGAVMEELANNAHHFWSLEDVKEFLRSYLLATA